MLEEIGFDNSEAWIWVVVFGIFGNLMMWLPNIMGMPGFPLATQIMVGIAAFPMAYIIMKVMEAKG